MTENQLPAPVALDEDAFISACEAAERAYQSEEEEGLAFDGAIKAGIRAYLAAITHPAASGAVEPALGVTEAMRRAHDTLIEINPSNYTHDEVCDLNERSVEAILILADALGERHGKTDEWWAARRAALAAAPTPVPPMRERVEYALPENERFLRPDPETVYPKIVSGRCAACGVSMAALATAPEGSEKHP